MENFDEEDSVPTYSADVPSDVEEDPVLPKPLSRPRPKPKPINRPRSPEVQDVDGSEVEAQSPRPKKSSKSQGKRKADLAESGPEGSSKVQPANQSSHPVDDKPSDPTVGLRKRRK